MTITRARRWETRLMARSGVVSTEPPCPDQVAANEADAEEPLAVLPQPERQMTTLLRHHYQPGWHDLPNLLLQHRRFNGVSILQARFNLLMARRLHEPRFAIRGHGVYTEVMLLHLEAHRSSRA